MRKLGMAVFASAAALAFAAPASAAVTVAPINGPNLETFIKASKTITENDTTLVYGSTENGNSADVKFTGNTNINITDGAGFAAISDAGGAEDFRVLTIELLKGFTDLQFSLSLEDAGYVIVQYALASAPNVFLNPFSGGTFTQNGSTNRDYQLSSNPDEVLAALRITACTTSAGCVAGIGSGTGIQLERQNSVTLAAVSAVPEPGTWAMMLLGFGGMGVAMRRSRRRTTAQLAQMA